ncbi:hypothetical protein [Dactylosporangium sp. NPDC000521]|uniref:hypothetical protein n=1 Tax=Dactylosporangium sp. NPDC000521 TaxID=3363975 RepID=UPI003680C280
MTVAGALVLPVLGLLGNATGIRMLAKLQAALDRWTQLPARRRTANGPGRSW